ncbi:MAG: amino acid adenylation domain-containing protein [Isosphaeraceae bacterium]
MSIESPAEILEGFLLSPLQRRLWKERSSGNVRWARCVITASGVLDAERLAQGLRSLVARHEILRSVFRQVSGMAMPVQVAGGPEDVAIESGCEAPTGMPLEQVAGALLELPSPGPPAWGEGPMVRARLVETGSDRNAIVLEIPALVADLNSLPILFEDLARAYGAVVDPLAEQEALPHLEYSEWHNEAMESADRAQGEAYWREVLRATETGRFTEPDEVEPAPGESVVVPIDESRSDLLRGCADTLGCGLDVVILAGLIALDSRLSGTMSPTIATLSSGRKFQEFARSVGPFGGFLPIRVTCREEMSFEQLVRAVQAERERANDWEEFYYSATLESLVLSECPSYAFDFAELPRPLTAMGVTFTLSDLDVDGGPSEVRISVRDRGEGLVFRAHHDPNRICEAAVRRRLDHLTTLLAEAARAPRTPIGLLNMLSPEWRRRVVHDWNRTAPGGAASPPVPVHRRFEAQTDETPNAPAVTLLDQSLSFAELDRRANRIAAWLIRHGVGAEVPVGLLLDRSTDMMAAVLGVWKAGGCYLPLDPSHPEGRLARILDTVQPPVILTQRRLARRLARSSARVLALDADDEALARERDARPRVAVHPDQLAYIIFTSGSTGEPKGVAVPHRSLANLREALAETVYDQFGPDSRVGLNAPLSFDASVKQFLQLTRGCTLCLIPDELRRDGPALLRYALAQKIDALDLTPSHLRLLMADKDIWETRAFRQLLLGGESLDQRLWSELSSMPGLTVYNVYGPTECTDVATTAAVAPHSTPTIGRPLANLRVYILDGSLQPVPPGVLGEIYIGGAGVARGYYGHPSWTAERFLPDPFAEVPGARMYRTGDLGRFRSDGRIVFAGRNDRQLKVRGYRIELGEIEATLRRHPAVKEAAVTTRSSETGDANLAAYVVPLNEPSPDAAGYRLPNGLLIAHCNKNETDYLYQEIFEKHSYTQHGVGLFEGMCVFDVGANIGMFTLYVKHACPDARIHAFEPIPPIHETLHRNLSRFGSSVTVHRFGLYGRDATERFTFYPRYTMMSGVARWARPDEEVKVISQYLSREAEQTRDEGHPSLLEHVDDLLEGRFDAEEYECTLRPLSAVIQEQGVERIDLLKVDVQRAEMQVLEGIAPEHWPIIRQVVMEVHDDPGQESAGRIEQVTRLLEVRGFRVTVEQDPLLKGTDRYNLYAVRPDFTPPSNKPTANGNSHANGEAIASVVLSAQDLKDYLTANLPDYMVPASITFMSSMPLNRSGKVDYSALPEPNRPPGRDRPRSHEFADPREQVLAQVWAATLGMGDVGPEDNFFELGGDSIRSIQVQSASRKQDLHFTLQQLFRHQTIRALVQSLEVQPVAREETPAIRPFALISEEDRARMPSDVIDAYPLAQLQAGMHYHTELRDSGGTYHVLSSVDLKAQLDPDRMREAVRRLADAHPILRSSFHLIEFSRPLQLVHQSLTRDPVTIFDIRGESRESQEARIADFLTTQQQRPFDFAHGLLFSVYVFHLSDSSFLLIFEHYHGLLDGLSVHLAISELIHQYAQLLGLTDEPVPPPPRTSYRDFVALELEALESQPLRDFWLDKFRGAELQRIPRHGPPPESTAREMRTLATRLTAALSDRLREQARSHGLPLKSLLLAAHLRVMGLITGSTAPLTGLVVNVRPETEDGERVLGLFLNTLPIRVPLVPGTWIDLARRAFEHENELLDYRRIPLSEIIRRLGGRPLFETFFNYSHFPGRGGSFLESLKPRSREGLTVDIDFTLSVDFELEDHTGQILLSLIYDVDQLCEPQVRRIADYLSTALEALADGPDARWDVSFASNPKEYTRLTREWVSGPSMADVPGTVPEMIERSAARTPSAIAVRHDGRGLSYQELDRRANQLAHHLRALGVEPEHRVAVDLDRDEELIVCLLAIGKAGAAYLPLNPHDPHSRREFLLSDSSVTLVLTQQGKFEPACSGAVRILRIDQEAGDIASQPTHSPGLAVHPLQAAYVLYTSGSTGRPKPVVVPHAAVANLLNWSSREFRAEEFSGTLAATPLGFDLSVFEIFAPLVNGGTVIVAEDLFALPRLPERDQVSMVNTVPSLLAEAMRLDRLPPRVRSVNLAGEPLPKGLVLEVFDQSGVETVRNLYGPTEATVYATCRRIGRAEPGPFSIGRPIAGVRTYVVDANLTPVPEGEPGELLLGGACLARGYGSDPAMTAERFVPDPFGPVPGQRLYRTGDIVRWSPQGMLEFLGRQDRQAKVRGCRVELGEIEACLREHPSVRDCVVRAWNDASGHSRLIAYVMPASADANQTELARHLRLRLPQAICPDKLMILSEWPLLPNGKVDASALPAPESGTGSRPIVLPTDTVEQDVREVWSQMLGIAASQISTDRPFAELGGYSLLATRLVGTIRERFQVELPLCVFRENPTVLGVATRIRAAGNESLSATGARSVSRS